MGTQDQHPEILTAAGIRSLLPLLAGINHRACREFNSGVALFNRFGQAGALTPRDIDRARECTRPGAQPDLDQLRAALRPLAGLPVDPDSLDTDTLYTLDNVPITAGHIRQARQLVRTS